MDRSRTPTPWSRTTEAALIVGFWGILGALALVRRSLDPRGPSGVDTPGLIITLAEYGLWAALTPLVFALVRRLRFEPGGRLWRALAYVAAAFAIAVLVEWVRQRLFAAAFPDAFDARWRGGRGHRPRFQPGLAGIVMQFRFLDEFVIAVAVLVAGFARDALVRLRERETHTARLEAQLADARLSALRMQLNPHFLFNTLHAVSALVERDPSGVRTMIARLSALLRRVLEGGNRHEVPLREELAFLRDYLDVQRVRFQGRLDVEEHIGDDTLDALVPNLVLQPLVENAVQHGVSRLEEGTGRIVVEARREGGDLILSVRDNGPGPAPAASGASGVGLANTRQRLDALYGDAASFRLAAGAGGGGEARVALPYHTADDLVLHG